MNSMPDDNPFRAEVKDDNPFRAEEPVSGPAAFIDRLGTTAAENILGIPRALGQAPSMIAAGVQGVAGLATGQGFDFQRRLEATKEDRGVLAELLHNIPAPKVSDISAGVRSVPALLPGGETVGERFRGEKADIAAQEQALREARPFATAAGDVAGDIATIVTGRLPFAKGIAKAEQRLAGISATKQLGPGARRLVDRWVIKNETIRLMARGAGRSLEAGFEAAALDILKGDDPLETAGWAAGGQLAGSAVLTGTKGIFSGGALRIGNKIALSAFATGALFQIFAEATPGGADSLIANMTTGFEKVTLAMALGAISGMAGAGRLRGTKFANDLPLLSDAISAIPRIGVISLVEDWVNAPENERQRIETVVNKVAESPDYFGQFTPQISKAMLKGGFNDMLKTLSENETFQKLMFAISPPQLGPGIRAADIQAPASL